jgi:hypothetical protein
LGLLASSHVYSVQLRSNWLLCRWNQPN